MKKCWLPLKFNYEDCQSMALLFNQMAAKGWYVQKLNAESVWFVKGEKADVSYIVDLFPNERNQHDDREIKEYHELFANTGWEFVDGYTQFQVFKAMGECLPVHTDAELQLAIFNQFKTEGISTYLLLALFVMIVVGFTLLYPQSILGDDLYLFTSVLFVLVILKQILAFIHAQRMIKQYRQSLLSKGEMNWQGNAKQLMIKSIIKLLYKLGLNMLLIILVLRALWNNGGNSENMSMITLLVSAVFISALTKQNQGRRLSIGKSVGVYFACFLLLQMVLTPFKGESMIDEGAVITINQGSDYKYSHSQSLFIPEQYTFETEGYRYELYTARNEKIAGLLFDAYLRQYAGLFTYPTELKTMLIPISDSAFDEGYYVDENKTGLIGRMNQSVIIIEYNGSLDTPQIIDTINTQLAMINVHNGGANHS